MRMARRSSFSKSLGFSHSAKNPPAAGRRPAAGGLLLTELVSYFLNMARLPHSSRLRISASTQVIRCSRTLLFLFRIVLFLGDRSPPRLPAGPAYAVCTDTLSAPQLPGSPTGNNEAVFSAKSEQDFEAEKRVLPARCRGPPKHNCIQ